jgi:DNA-binding response OmpR family regulator
MKNPDRIYTIEMIYEMVWDEVFTYNAKNTVMVHIKNLRNKLIKAAKDKKHRKIHDVYFFNLCYN